MGPEEEEREEEPGGGGGGPEEEGEGEGMTAGGMGGPEGGGEGMIGAVGGLEGMTEEEEEREGAGELFTSLNLLLGAPLPSTLPLPPEERELRRCLVGMKDLFFFFFNGCASIKSM